MPKSNSYLRMKDYFANLVEQSTFLKTFIGYFQRELANKRYNLETPCLALFGYSLELDGEKMSTVAVRKMSFAIMMSGVPSDEMELQYKAIDESEALALKVVARLKLDANNQDHFLYNSLIKNSVEIRPFEIEDTGMFGTEVCFDLKNFQTMKVLADDWKDLEKIC